MLMIALMGPHAVVAQSSMVRPVTIAEVTGAGAAVQFATAGRARWVQVIALSTNGAVIRCGDSNVSSTRGLPVAAGGGFMFPAITVDTRESTAQHFYDLSSLYCYVANGDKIDIAYAQ